MPSVFFAFLIKLKHFNKLLKTWLFYNRVIKEKKEVTKMNRNDQEYLVQKIRTQYTEKEHTQLDALKELDGKVKRPANIFAYVFGTLSALIMGSGMSILFIRKFC